ncbi:hypothetical protein F5051DRAFT_434420 [Lentinula edodes]|nr:hypothetical protein F5051DRAFT_434420 [Lentinula edodes]
MTVPAESSVPAKSTFDQNGATGLEHSEIQGSTHHDHANPDTLRSTSKHGDASSSLSDLQENYPEPSKINQLPGRFPVDDFGLPPRLNLFDRSYYDYNNNVCDPTLLFGNHPYSDQELRLPPVSPSLNVNNFATTSTVYPKPSVASGFILPNLNFREAPLFGWNNIDIDVSGLQYHQSLESSNQLETRSTVNNIMSQGPQKERETPRRRKKRTRACYCCRERHVKCRRLNPQGSDVNLSAESSVSTESTFDQVLLNGATGVEHSEIQGSTHHDHADPNTLGSTSKHSGAASSLSDRVEYCMIHFTSFSAPTDLLLSADPEPSTINHLPGRFPADDFGLTPRLNLSEHSLYRSPYGWSNKVYDTTNL